MQWCPARKDLTVLGAGFMHWLSTLYRSVVIGYSWLYDIELKIALNISIIISFQMIKDMKQQFSGLLCEIGFLDSSDPKAAGANRNSGVLSHFTCFLNLSLSFTFFDYAH